MGIANRINRVAEHFAPKGLFDGTTVKDITRAGYFGPKEERADYIRPGVKRAAVFFGMRMVVHKLFSPRFAAEAIALREKYGIPLDATYEQVIEFMMGWADKAGFTPLEKRKLQRSFARLARGETQ